MASFREPLVANVAEAGDMFLYASLLALTLVVGLALLAIDTAIGNLHERRSQKRHPRLGDNETGEHV